MPAVALRARPPFGSHYLSAFGSWFSVAALALAYLLQWSVTRATGVAVWRRTLRYPPGRTAGVALLVTGAVAIVTEVILLGHGLLTAAITVGILALMVGMACLRVHLAGIRKSLRTGAGAL